MTCLRICRDRVSGVSRDGDAFEMYFREGWDIYYLWDVYYERGAGGGFTDGEGVLGGKEERVF